MKKRIDKIYGYCGYDGKSDYAADAVSRVVKDGIIAGANGKINPLAKATRAEIAVMLNRVLNK